MLLLKWIFNFLLVLWLWQALIRPLLFAQSQRQEPPPNTPKPPETDPSPQPRRFSDEEGDYIDYEEIK